MSDNGSQDIVAWARESLEGIIPGRWFWGGNTDVGDIGLCGRMPGLGVVDVLRTCVETITDEQIGQEWVRQELSEYIDREDYVEARRNHPNHYLAFGRPDALFVEYGRDLAIYEVARNQGLPDDTPRDHPQVYRADVVGVRNKHAQFLADSPELVRGLLAEVERLRALLTAADTQGVVA